MSRILSGPKCRLCRRERQKLFLKGEKCFTAKCPVSRRGYPPGIHGQATFKLTEYGRQLREKQKIRRSYGITERQLSNTYAAASRAIGDTGRKMLEKLESRLDNAVYRASFAPSRSAARQLISHGHFRVNGKRVDVPSYAVRPNDIITVREGSQKKAPFVAAAVQGAMEQAGAVAASSIAVPSWIKVEINEKRATIVQLPDAEELDRLGFNHQMVVEFYSR